jgi:translation elongation factor EF-4
LYRYVPVSAKTGLNMEGLLVAVVERVEPPKGNDNDSAKLRMLLLDCHYDPYRGAVSVVQVVVGLYKLNALWGCILTNGATQVECNIYGAVQI